MYVISGHSFESFCFDEVPKFQKSSVDDHWIKGRVFYFSEQFFRTHNFHGMSLGSSNEDMMFSLLDFKSLFVVSINNLSNPLFINVFMTFAFEELNDLL